MSSTSSKRIAPTIRCTAGSARATEIPRCACSTKPARTKPPPWQSVPSGQDARARRLCVRSQAATSGRTRASKLSSYYISNNGSISLLTGSVGANQSAACWVVITDNGKYAYTTNTASNNLTNFGINKNTGAINVNTAIAATTGMGPIDAALSKNSKYLYILNGASHSISVYKVDNDGSLSNVQTVTGLPVGANGLAAR